MQLVDTQIGVRRVAGLQWVEGLAVSWFAQGPTLGVANQPFATVLIRSRRELARAHHRRVSGLRSLRAASNEHPKTP